MTIEEAERVVREITSYQPRDERVRIEISGGLNRPPLEFTEVNEALFNEAVKAGASLGMTLSGTLAGGGSDGNFTSALGVPTLDGLGAVGIGPHARHEHIDIPASLDRVALLACLLSS
jgi:glutamate carboxypeptidase